MTAGKFRTSTQPPNGKAPGVVTASRKPAGWDAGNVYAWYGITYIRARARWWVFGMFAPYLLTVCLGLMFGYATAWGHQRGDSENVGLLAWFTMLSAIGAMFHTFTTLIMCIQLWWGEHKHWKSLVTHFKKNYGFDPLSDDPPLELQLKYPRKS